MWSKLRRLGKALVIIAALVSVSCSVGNKPRPTAGTTAPDFTLMNQDDKPVRLSQYRGKWVVLYFYPADFSQAGMAQARNFQRDLAKYRQANAVLLGVSGNQTATHREFIAKEQLQYDLLSDGEEEVSREYGTAMRYHMMTLTARSTYLIDPTGKVAEVFHIVDGDHSAKVLRALATLQQ